MEPKVGLYQVPDQSKDSTEERGRPGGAIAVTKCFGANGFLQ